jgi:biotin carboxyl carrier protein
MKRYQITVDGRSFDVRLLSDPRRRRVEVEVDGEALTVDVEVLSGSEREAATEGAGELAASVAPPTSEDVPSTAVEGAASSDNAVTAPLPGVIKTVSVRPGQQVTFGDELLVIEAMKMDNIIRATREGTVGTVHAVEGHRVAHGELMLEFLPRAS